MLPYEHAGRSARVATEREGRDAETPRGVISPDPDS